MACILKPLEIRQNRRRTEIRKNYTLETKDQELTRAERLSLVENKEQESVIDHED